MNEMLKRALAHRTTEQQMLDELKSIHGELKAQTTALAALVINTQKPPVNAPAMRPSTSLLPPDKRKK